MELVVFDLDGTLLNRHSEISEYTSETLRLLNERNIAYTVATGRTLHGARAILEGHSFALPQVYKNGVMIWHPDSGQLSSGATLTRRELQNVVGACVAQRITPFVFTLEKGDVSVVYHPPLLNDIERKLIRAIGVEAPTQARPLDELSDGATITHVNAIGDGRAIESVLRSVNDEPHLVAYSGTALEGEQCIEILAGSINPIALCQSAASKGGAIESMKRLLGLERVICFGDSDNDLSMFEAADESYAPANANDSIKSVATAVIGHHDDEGIAHFLRERFALDAG